MIPFSIFLAGAAAAGGFTAARGCALAFRAAAPRGSLLCWGAGLAVLLAALLAGIASWRLFVAAIAAWDPVGFICRQFIAGALLAVGSVFLFRAAQPRGEERLAGLIRAAGGVALLLSGVCIVMSSAPFGFVWLWLALGGQGLPR